MRLALSAAAIVAAAQKDNTASWRLANAAGCQGAKAYSSTITNSTGPLCNSQRFTATFVPAIRFSHLEYSNEGKALARKTSTKTSFRICTPTLTRRKTFPTSIIIDLKCAIDLTCIRTFSLQDNFAHIDISNGRRKGQISWRQECRWKDFFRRWPQEAAESLCSCRSSGKLIMTIVSRHIRHEATTRLWFATPSCSTPLRYPTST
ncbi:hypothetical protein BKA67DRAFT_329214 [Truncatella angustata]|uniref:Uncharacterized protein n=1 Tax=Truncatella angustata TaxID=152316 RepID=A0A9P8UFS4_9PEZI|nr:uncharacterized protein BKA67DRAFT_329214 [Truncatella angustata]KAH6651442.1 hypothetical protein BKA67DRAFT_329214 [Truncatella angustata]